MCDIGRLLLAMIVCHIVYILHMHMHICIWLYCIAWCVLGVLLRQVVALCVVLHGVAL